MMPINSAKKVTFTSKSPSPREQDTSSSEPDNSSDYDNDVPESADEYVHPPSVSTDAFEMVDKPPVPSEAKTDGFKSTLTIFTHGEQLIHMPNLNINRRYSCELSKTNLPCINKAVSRLVSLQTYLEKNDICSASGLKNNQLIAISGLKTQNVGLGVIEEIKILINRMNEDRINTIVAYQTESEKVKKLERQVHKVEQQRYVVLPRVVQAEHELYAKGIAEYKAQLPDIILERKFWEKKVREAREQNEQMKKDVSALQDQCPMIKEKIEVDKKGLIDVSSQLQGAKKELQKVIEEMNEANNKSSLADGRAEKERSELRKELDGIRHTLDGVYEELHQAQGVHNERQKEVEKISGLIDDANARGQVLDEKISKTRKEESDANDKVDNSKTFLLEIAQNIKSKRRANKRLSEEMASKHLYIATELESRDKKKQRELRLSKTCLREALQNTVKMEREIIDFKKELIVSIKKAREDEKSTFRAQFDLKHLDEQLKVVVEEVQRLANVNSKLALNAHKTEEEIVNTENALRNSLTGLRRALQEEIQSKTSLLNKMATETEDFEKYQKVSSNKLEKTTHKKDELEAIHKKYTLAKNKLADKLRRINDERDKLQKSINETLTSFATEKSKLEKEIATLIPENEEVKKELEETQKAISDLKWRSDLVLKKVQETLEGTKVVMKIQKQTNDSINTLERQIGQFENDLADGQELEKQLKANWNHIKDNQLLLRNQHKAALDKRLALFWQLKESVEDFIEDNVKISEVYNKLQSKHMKVKRLYHKTANRKLNLEQNLKQTQKVSILQKRMHKALICYYMHRGYHNRTVLTDFGKGAAINLHHMEKIHRNLCDIISKTDTYIGKHGSGVARQQPRIASAEIARAMKNITRLPVIIETPPPPITQIATEESDD